MAATDFCFFFLSVAKHVRILPQVTKMYIIMYICNSWNVVTVQM